MKIIYTIDVYLLAITQAFAHWYERKYRHDNYKLAYRYPIVIWVCGGWVAIGIQHFNLYVENLNVPIMQIVIACTVLCILYAIILTLFATVMMYPLVAMNRRMTKEALLSGDGNPMIRKNYFLRINLLIGWFIVCMLYLFDKELIDTKLLSVMPGLVLYVYFISVQPIQIRHTSNIDG